MKNREVKKLKIGPYTLSNELVLRGLESINLLNNKEPYYLVGGVATQFYLPAFCRRPTSDIDVSIVKPLNHEEFKTMVKPIIEYFLDNHYSVSSRKHSRTFYLNIENEEKNKILIEFSRRNKKNFDKSKNRLERELKNSKKNQIGTRAECYIVSVEDIILPKLVRSVGSIIRNPEYKTILPKGVNSDKDYVGYISKRLDTINKLREDATLSPADLRIAENLRFVSDIYDMRALYKHSKIRKKYFERAMKDWESLDKNPEQKEFLMDFITSK